MPNRVGTAGWALTRSLHASSRNETPAGMGPTGASMEASMEKHAWLPLRIVVILAIRVKIIIRK